MYAAVAAEASIREAWDRCDYPVAATRTLEAFGPGILGYLAARLGNEWDGREAFSEFVEDFWRGLPDFQWRCPVRAWAYCLARHAAARLESSPQRRPGHNLPLSEISEVAASVLRARTTTLPHERSEVKDRLRELRARLPEVEQSLLVLRVDKRLSWRELAVVLSEEEGTLEQAELEREAARLRKRFQLVKEKLRKMIAAEGLSRD